MLFLGFLFWALAAAFEVEGQQQQQLLAGKVCYITGATSGLGEFVAMEAAKEGCTVSLTGRRRELGEAVKAKVEAAGGTAMFTVCDVSDEECVEASIRATVEAFGSLDLVLNNAGGAAAGDRGPPHLMSAADFEAVTKSNVVGAFLCMKHEIAAMLAHNVSGGSIVNVGSIYSLKAQAFGAAYVASKHALAGLTKTFGVAYAGDGIRVNNLAPTYFRTPLTEAIFTAEDLGATTISDWQPGGRPCELRELWGPLLFLWSDASSFYTAQNLVVDGGLTNAVVPPKLMRDGYDRARATIISTKARDDEEENAVGEEGLGKSNNDDHHYKEL